jgi:hypothetical protein
VNDFLQGLREGQAEQEGMAERVFNGKMLKRLLDKVADSPEAAKHIRYDAGDEFSFEWFNDAYSCPVKLHAQRVLVTDLTQLIISKRMPKSKLWKAYFAFKAEHEPEAPVGMVFRLKNFTSSWIMHNATLIPAQRGENMIVRPAADDDKRLILCPYDVFLTGLKGVWAP